MQLKVVKTVFLTLILFLAGCGPEGSAKKPLDDKPKRLVSVRVKDGLKKIKVGTLAGEPELQKHFQSKPELYTSGNDYDALLKIYTESKSEKRLVYKKGQIYYENEIYKVRDPNIPTGHRVESRRVMKIRENDEYSYYNVVEFKLDLFDQKDKPLIRNHALGHIIDSNPHGIYGIINGLDKALNPYLPQFLQITLDSDDVFRFDQYHKEIIAGGQDVNAGIGAQGKTMLMDASQKGRLEVMDYLLSHGANTEQTDAQGKSALFYASMAGNLAAVERLVSYKADINKQDIQGWTALFHATSKGQTKVADYLIKKGADPKHISKNGLTLAQLEVQSQGEYLRTALQTKDLARVQELIQKGVSLNQPFASGGYVLEAALESKEPKVLDLLLAKGLDIKSPGSYNPNFSALNFLYKGGHSALMEKLLKNGYRLFKGKSDKESVVELALQKKDYAALKFLLKYAEGEYFAKNFTNTQALKDLMQAKEIDLGLKLYAVSGIPMDYYTLSAIMESAALQDIKELMTGKNLVADKQVEFSSLLRSAEKNKNPQVYKNLCENYEWLAFWVERISFNHGFDKILNRALLAKNEKLLEQIVQNKNFSAFNFFYRFDPSFKRPYNLGKDEAAHFNLIHLLASLGKEELIRKMIKAHPESLGYLNGLKQNALFYAVMQEDIKVAQILLQAGISANIKDKRNLSALDLAKGSKNEKMMALLQKYEK